MPNLEKLISVFDEARCLLDHPDNDFVWSFWEDRKEALEEIDNVLSRLRSGTLPDNLWSLEIYFAPTGPIQEVSVSSGWGDKFLALADRFDEALASEDLEE